MLKLPPPSLYIHLPWCVRKCPYCDFNSHQNNGPIPEAQYIQCLENDLQEDLSHYNITRPLHTIFIGGGTPSLFSAAAINTLLTKIDQMWGIPSDTEITMEANPGTVEQQRFADYRKAGINRLSLGIQSFDNEKLQMLGRIHDGEEAIKAVKIARNVGFENLNLDLMFGLPQQSIEAGLADLKQAIDLHPTHISWYQLTLEPNTIFYKKPPRLPNEDRIFELQQMGQHLLATNGFRQYEVSAYTQASRECQHNINYWQFGDYIGIGAGAHGKISLDAERIIRTRKVKQPNSYLQRPHAVAAETTLTTNDRAFEYMLNALRLTQPVNLSDFSKKTGLTIGSIKTPLQTAIEKKLILVKDNFVQKTELGQHFLNDLLALFL